jgi:Skp family chaperone for outer membrane proteins
MKRVSLLAVSLVFAAVFSASAFGQAGAAQPGAGKIGWINTAAFGDDKEGVTKYINALKAVDNEMKPKVTELQGIQTQLKTLSDDITKLQGSASTNPAVNQQTLQQQIASKTEQGQALQRTFEFKKKEYDASLESTSTRVLGPVSDDIQKAIEAYAKQKGYSVVLDIAALAQANAILVLDPAANITKDFIVYFNTRPAGATATTAKP